MKMANFHNLRICLLVTVVGLTRAQYDPLTALIYGGGGGQPYPSPYPPQYPGTMPQGGGGYPPMPGGQNFPHLNPNHVPDVCTFNPQQPGAGANWPGAAGAAPAAPEPAPSDDLTAKYRKAPAVVTGFHPRLLRNKHVIARRQASLDAGSYQPSSYSPPVQDPKSNKYPANGNENPHGINYPHLKESDFHYGPVMQARHPMKEYDGRPTAGGWNGFVHHPQLLARDKDQKPSSGDAGPYSPPFGSKNFGVLGGPEDGNSGRPPYGGVGKQKPENPNGQQPPSNFNPQPYNPHPVYPHRYPFNTLGNRPQPQIPANPDFQPPVVTADKNDTLPMPPPKNNTALFVPTVQGTGVGNDTVGNKNATENGTMSPPVVPSDKSFAPSPSVPQDNKSNIPSSSPWNDNNNAQQPGSNNNGINILAINSTINMNNSTDPPQNATTKNSTMSTSGTQPAVVPTEGNDNNGSTAAGDNSTVTVPANSTVVASVNANATVSGTKPSHPTSTSPQQVSTADHSSVSNSGNDTGSSAEPSSAPTQDPATNSTVVVVPGSQSTNVSVVTPANEQQPAHHRRGSRSPSSRYDSQYRPILA